MIWSVFVHNLVTLIIYFKARYYESKLLMSNDFLTIILKVLCIKIYNYVVKYVVSAAIEC